MIGSGSRPVGGRGPDSPVDGQLLEWGARHVFPRVRSRGRPEGETRGQGGPTANDVRELLRRVTSAGARQVMLKVTGGGRGMRAFSAHLRYISRLGRVEKGRSEALEDESGHRIEGAAELRDLARDWRTAGSLIPEQSRRREVLNMVLSMPAGTPPEAVRDAARDFAVQTFEGHKWVMALHTDTPAPHVHLAVRVERADRVRLQPRREHLRAWRARFAELLQDRGVNAIAMPGRLMPTRPRTQRIGVLKAREQGRARVASRHTVVDAHRVETNAAFEGWRAMVQALRGSTDDDRQLAAQLETFIGLGRTENVQRERVATTKGNDLGR